MKKIQLIFAGMFMLASSTAMAAIPAPALPENAELKEFLLYAFDHRDGGTSNGITYVSAGNFSHPQWEQGVHLTIADIENLPDDIHAYPTDLGHLMHINWEDIENSEEGKFTDVLVHYNIAPPGFDDDDFDQINQNNLMGFNIRFNLRKIAKNRKHHDKDKVNPIGKFEKIINYLDKFPNEERQIESAGGAA